MSREAPLELPVFRVFTFDAESRCTTRETVACPESGTLTVEHCQRCPRAQGFGYGGQNQLQRVYCKLAATAPVDEASSPTIPLRRARVYELMTRNVVCVRASLPLDAVMLLFVETHLKAVPVVDERGEVIGMLEESDVSQAIQAGDPLARCVGDLMLPMRIAIMETLSASQAAGLMVYEGVQRMPVISCEGQVVGILSATDLLYWLARADGYVLPAPHKPI